MLVISTCTLFMMVFIISTLLTGHCKGRKKQKPRKIDTQVN